MEEDETILDVDKRVEDEETTLDDESVEDEETTLDEDDDASLDNTESMLELEIEELVVEELNDEETTEVKYGLALDDNVDFWVEEEDEMPLQDPNRGWHPFPQYALDFPQ